MGKIKSGCTAGLFVAMAIFFMATFAHADTGFRGDFGIGVTIPTMSGDFVDDPMMILLDPASGLALQYEDSPNAGLGLMFDVGYAPLDPLSILLLFDLGISGTDNSMKMGTLQDSAGTSWLSWGLYLNAEYAFLLDGSLNPYIFAGPGIRDMSLLDASGDGLDFESAFSFDVGVGVYWKILGARLTYNWVQYSDASFEVENIFKESHSVDTDGSFISLLLTVGSNRGR